MKKLSIILAAVLLSNLAGCVGQSSTTSAPNTNQAAKTSSEKQILSSPYINISIYIISMIDGNDIIQEWKHSIGMPISSETYATNLLIQELQRIQQELERVAANLFELKKDYTQSVHYDSSSTLATIYDRINVKFKQINQLLADGIQIDEVDDFDKLKYIDSREDFKRKILEIASFSSVSELEKYYEKLSGSESRSPSKINYLETYWKQEYDYLRNKHEIEPWSDNKATAFAYKNFDENGIELKSIYNSILDHEALENLVELQKIAYIFEYLSYLKITKGIEVPLPSFININSSLSPETNYKNAIEAIKKDVKVKANDVVATLEKSQNLYKLPLVGRDGVSSLPENCLQPNDIPRFYSLEEIKHDWLYWSGYGGKRTGKLLTMCKDKSGKYVSTYPIFLGVPGNEDKNENLFCPYLFYKDEYLFCNPGPLFPNSIIREHQPSKYEDFVKNIHIDSASNKDGHLYKFTQEDLNDTLYSIKNFNSNAATKGALKSHWIEINTPYVRLNTTFTTFEFPETIPLVINFHDAKTGNHYYCTTTLNYDVSRRDKLPSLTAADIGAKSIRCGNDGQFKLELNPDHSDTFNISPWN